MLGEYYILKYSPNTTRHIRGRCVDCVRCVQGINPKYYDLLFGDGTFFFKKKNNINSLFLLHSFHIFPKCEGLSLLHNVVCKHLADVLLKILLHKIDTCILVVAEPDINLGKYEQAYIDRR